MRARAGVTPCLRLRRIRPGVDDVGVCAGCCPCKWAVRVGATSAVIRAMDMELGAARAFGRPAAAVGVGDGSQYQERLLWKHVPEMPGQQNQISVALRLV